MSLIEAARTGGSADVLRTLRTVCDARGLDGLAQRLADLGDLVAWDMRDVNEALETVPRGESLVHRSAHHLLERGGKRLRPMCVAVAARGAIATRGPRPHKQAHASPRPQLWIITRNSQVEVAP